MTSTGRTSAGPQGLLPGHGRRRTVTGGPIALTVGAEEEFLLVDPVSREVSAQAGAVVAEAAGELGDRVGPELTRYQVEVRTDPHRSLADFAEQVRSTRVAVVRAAAHRGLQVVSSGSPVLGQVSPPPLTACPRYTASAATFGALDDEQCACACHIHVGVPDLATALQISNRLRPWLPALIALTGNSPFWAGRDTGYASWRTTTWGRWPVAGPPPYFESPSHFEDLVAGFISTGSIMDRGGLYWDIRPSHHVPTLEYRVADATTTPGETVLLAGLIRAMTATALQAATTGDPVCRPAPEMLRAACWRAARDGLAGQGIDLATGRLSPAVDQIDQLLSWVQPALKEHGDAELVNALWSRLRATGSGADRQRAAYRRRGRLADIVDHLTSSVTASD
ncbi:glutamate--cysteine ligase [Streptomyces sp. t39]|uniref:carboxylate-amine ligase n=1 Tax=Streptomyces sp. t39 TaxID=1828156 RepID=UPI0011CE19D1|nr:glutamate--cysteine ligase [Streptomyces sp. t39]TXS48183.1 YbdK family carboxylate-amine ligase [Streptomyces sp. t39]